LSLIQLEKVVGQNWPWFGKYGDELLEVFKKMTILPLQPKPKRPRGQKKVLNEHDREEERITKRSRTSSSKKPTQIPDPSLAAVTHVPPRATLPATPLQVPHNVNPYAHLLTPTGSSPHGPYLSYQSQLPYYYSSPLFSVPIQLQQVTAVTPQQNFGNIASSSKTPFPPIDYQFLPYNPKNTK
jgi:hypothetical protein